MSQERERPPPPGLAPAPRASSRSGQHNCASSGTLTRLSSLIPCPLSNNSSNSSRPPVCHLNPCPPFSPGTCVPAPGPWPGRPSLPPTCSVARPLLSAQALGKNPAPVKPNEQARLQASGIGLELLIVFYIIQELNAVKGIISLRFGTHSVTVTASERGGDGAEKSRAAACYPS